VALGRCTALFASARQFYRRYYGPNAVLDGSDDGHRTIPLLPLVANALKEWKLQCPKTDLGLTFPSRGGKIDSHNNIVARGLWPPQVAAGITADSKAKYRGLHSLRHFGVAAQKRPVSARSRVDQDDVGRLRASLSQG
jgi:integrase